MERVLSCECGADILVTKAQAGSQLNCPSCGAAINVPTLRGLSELPVAQGKKSEINDPYSSQQQDHRISAWRWRGPAMAICLVAFVIASFYAFKELRVWNSIDTSYGVDDHIEFIGEKLDASGPDQLSQIWDSYSGISLQRPRPPDYKLFNDFAAEKLHNGQIGLGISLAMLVCLLAIWISASWGKRPAKS